jgi:hypothetical protein
MRIACQVFVLLSAGVLVSCAPPAPSETVQLSRPSAFDAPLDHRWRKASETQPVAILLGRAETTRVLFPRKAVLRVSCYRKPIVHVSYDVGLKSGPIAVAYRFDAKTEQKGVVRVRGTHRNMLVIDNPPAAIAFQADLRSSSTLKVQAARPFDLYDAFFRWDPGDKILLEVLAACNERMLSAAGRQQPGPEAADDVADDDIRDVLPED